MRSFDVWWCSILKIISDLILALFGEFINKVERLLNFGTCIVMIVYQSLPDFSSFLQCQNLVEGFFKKIYLYVMCNITYVFSFVGFVSLLIDLQMSCPRSNSLYVNFHKIDKSWVHHPDCHSQGLCSPFPFIVVPLTSHFKIVGLCGICEKNNIFNNKWWYESVRTT